MQEPEKNRILNMNNIKDIKITKVVNPKVDNIYTLTYTENGRKKSKEVSKGALNIVKILLYHKEKNAFVLIRQFRPLVYINNPQFANRYELCGGREDKQGLSSLEIAKEEVLEECGYKVDTLEHITTFITTAKMTLFFGIVDESMRVNKGGGIDDEDIELIYLPLNKAKEFILNPKYPKRPAMAFSIMWFFNIKESFNF